MATTVTYSTSLVDDFTIADSFTANLSTFSNGTQFGAAYTESGGVVRAAIYSANGDIATGPFQISNAGVTASNPAIAELSNGNNVVVFDDGDSISFEISSSTTGLDVVADVDIGDTGTSKPDVAALTGGGFVAVYQDDVGGGDSDIEFSVFNNNGIFLSGGLVNVSAFTEGWARVAALDDGGFAIVWEFEAAGDTRIWTAVYNANGSVRRAADSLDAIGDINNRPDIVALDDGGFALVYSDSGWDEVEREVTYAEFAANGDFLEYTRITDNIQEEFDPDAALLSNGIVAVSYHDNLFGNFDPVVSFVDGETGQLLTPTGIRLNSSVSFEQNTSIAALNLSRFAVSWTGDGTVVEIHQLVRTTTGNGADDTVSGDDAVDVMYGNAGSDNLTGGANDDVLSGAAGNDTLVGGAGEDTLSGGEGDDQLVDSFTNTVLGGNGDDTIVNFFVSGGAWDGGSGNDTLDLSADNFSFVIDLSGPSFVIFTATFSNFENAIGSQSGDDILGSGIGNTLDGHDGNDEINGSGGDDTLLGGFGEDTLTGSSGADNMNGGADFDTVNYSNSTGPVSVDLVAQTATGGHATGDTLSGFEAALGSAFADTLTAGAGAQTLVGYTGSDTIEGGANPDTLSGGGSGGDTLVYASSSAGVLVDLATGAAALGHAGGDTISAFENVTGSAFADWLTGDSGVNVLVGNGGDDTLEGDLGGDTLNGGAGFDTASYAGAGGNVGISLLTGVGSGGGATGDTFISIESLTGSVFADVLAGDTGVNQLMGGAGDDTMNGSSGDDTLLGEAGDDNLTGSAGGDVVNGGGNADTANYSNSSGAVQINLDAGTAAGGHAAGDILISIENVFGSAFADTLTGDSGVNFLDGFNGNDTLAGGLGGDRFFGGNGFDTANYFASSAGVGVNLNTGVGAGGHAAGDLLFSVENAVGSAFADTFNGTTGANVVNGGAGDDAINGSSGNDSLFGEAGDDQLVGSAGADGIFGGPGGDTAFYVNSNGGVQINLTAGTAVGFHAAGDALNSIENLYGSVFTDTLTGDSGANTLEGAAGGDTLSGAGGDDGLFGHAGADFLNGGPDDDTLVGGAQADTFLYTIASFGDDTVIGFEDGLDLFNLAGSGLTFASFSESAFGGGTLLTVTSNPAHSIFIAGIAPAFIDGGDFV